MGGRTRRLEPRATSRELWSFAWSSVLRNKAYVGRALGGRLKRIAAHKMRGAWLQPAARHISVWCSKAKAPLKMYVFQVCPGGKHLNAASTEKHLGYILVGRASWTINRARTASASFRTELCVTSSSRSIRNLIALRPRVSAAGDVSGKWLSLGGVVQCSAINCISRAHSNACASWTIIKFKMRAASLHNVLYIFQIRAHL